MIHLSFCRKITLIFYKMCYCVWESGNYCISLLFKKNCICMKKLIFAIALAMCSYMCVVAQTIKFAGNARPVMEITPEKSTGLNKIYVIYGTAGVSMSYEATNPNASVKWYKYGAMGGGYAEEISGVARNGSVYTMAQVLPNSGYIIEEGDNRTYLWVVDYAGYRLSLSGIAPAAQQDCGTIALEVAGSGDDITYTTINGVGKKLSREMKLSYNTLEWNTDDSEWKLKEVVELYEGFKPSIHEQAPLCDTEVELSGDRFLAFWGEEMTVSSPVYNTHAIDARTAAEQTERDVPNEKTEGDENSLGGSAPAEITFTAYPTDAVAQREWQLSTDPEFGTVERSYTEDVYQETFNDAGTFYVRYTAKNADGSCDVTSDVYTVTIGESELVCPNAFSPQGSPGVNDEWRVQYKSLTSFRCWIFNRWGVQICELTDASQGWDGKYKGKYVKPGTYYYVIQARGADGKDYNRKGDINIINYNDMQSSGDSSGEGVME